MRPKRREVRIKNHPGVYRIEILNENGKWKFTGMYRAIKRIIKNGQNSKESACFDNVSDCTDFRHGKLQKGESVTLSPKMNSLSIKNQEYTFGKLFLDWKIFSDMKNRGSTAEFYERCAKHLVSLSFVPVDKIDAVEIDRLVALWKSVDYFKPKCRINFERELDLLKTVLNFYKSRKNSGYLVPIFEEHYSAAELKESNRNPLQHLAVDGFLKFLQALGKQKNCQYRTIATTQFGCTLRIGEVAGLLPKDIHFQDRLLVVSRTVSWSRKDWSYSVNPVKNGKQRVVTLPDFVWTELKDYMENVYPKLVKDSESKYLFQLSGLPITSKTISHAYARAKKLAGLGHLDFSGTHWVRKSGATIGRDATEDIYAVQQLLDHSSVKETQKYTARKLSHIRKVTDAINSEFELAKKAN